MKSLLLTGMFRSGTTTMARALNAHPDIAFASDPYLSFLKCLRSDLASDLASDLKSDLTAQPEHAIPPSYPLGDYYFDKQGAALLNAIENVDPDKSLQRARFEEILPSIKSNCDIYSKDLTPFVDDINGDSYRTYLHSMLEQIKNCYGTDKSKYSGFKEVWASEFTPFFLKANKDAKVILMIRDPRAVCSSKNSTSEKYPWLFLCRQWRKLTALAYKYSQVDFPGQVLVVKCEDFVEHPNESTKQICAFLDIEWHPSIANPAEYKGGDGKQWSQNTSYGSGAPEFNPATLVQWKKKLSSEEIQLIEYLCGPEMKLFDYEKSEQPHKNANDFLDNPPRINDDDIAAWMKQLVPNDLAYTVQQLKKEATRDALLQSVDAPSSDDVEACFLDDKIYQAIKNN